MAESLCIIDGFEAGRSMKGGRGLAGRRGGTCGQEGYAVSLQLGSAQGAMRARDQEALQILAAGPQPSVLFFG